MRMCNPPGKSITWRLSGNITVSVAYNIILIADNRGNAHEIEISINS